MEKLRGYSIFTLSLLYMAHQFLQLDIAAVITAAAVATFCICLPKMSILPRTMSVLMLSAGLLLFFAYQGEWSYLQQSVVDNLPLVVLFVAVPLLAYPLKNGGYVEYMYQFVNHFLKRDIGLIAFITTSTWILSSFLNLGALRVIHQLFTPKLEGRDRVFARAISQGFSLAAFWSPYFAGVAIILHMLQVPFPSFMLYGFLMVAIGLAISTGLVYLELQTGKSAQRSTFDEIAAASAQPKQSVSGEEQRFSQKKGWELLLVFIGLFVSLFLLERWLHYNLLLLITLVAFVYPILWSLAIKKGKEFLYSLRDYSSNVLPNVHNESVLFISAAFFSAMVQLTEFPEVLSDLFFSLSEISLFAVIFLIITFITAASMAGIHQILPISVLASSLSPATMGISRELFALTLIVSWGIVPLVSPMSPMNLIVSNLFKAKMYQVSRWNWKYVMIIIIVSTVTINFLNF